MLICCNIIANGCLKSSTIKRYLERNENELIYKYLNYFYSMRQNFVVSSHILSRSCVLNGKAQVTLYLILYLSIYNRRIKFCVAV